MAAGMVQAPVLVEINPVEEPAAEPPNPDEKKTPEKIKFRTYYFVYIYQS